MIVAPPVKHSDTGVACNLASYNMRMWCRAENLCHILRNGVKNMWVATSERDCAKQEEDLAFIASNLRVMQGESTLEADKGSLVLPILGLYAELYPPPPSLPTPPLPRTHPAAPHTSPGLTDRRPPFSQVRLPPGGARGGLAGRGDQSISGVRELYRLGGARWPLSRGFSPPGGGRGR